MEVSAAFSHFLTLPMHILQGFAVWWVVQGGKEKKMRITCGPIRCTIHFYNQIQHCFKLKNKRPCFGSRYLNEGKILALKASMVSVGAIASPTILIPFLVGAEGSCLILYSQSLCFHVLLAPCTPKLLVPLHTLNHPPLNKAESNWQTNVFPRK